jgi:hypothetical protein
MRVRVVKKPVAESEQKRSCARRGKTICGAWASFDKHVINREYGVGELVCLTVYCRGTRKGVRRLKLATV